MGVCDCRFSWNWRFDGAALFNIQCNLITLTQFFVISLMSVIVSFTCTNQPIQHISFRRSACTLGSCDKRRTRASHKHFPLKLCHCTDAMSLTSMEYLMYTKNSFIFTKVNYQHNKPVASLWKWTFIQFTVFRCAYNASRSGFLNVLVYLFLRYI